MSAIKIFRRGKTEQKLLKAETVFKVLDDLGRDSDELYRALESEQVGCIGLLQQIYGPGHGSYKMLKDFEKTGYPTGDAAKNEEFFDAFTSYMEVREAYYAKQRAYDDLRAFASAAYGKRNLWTEYYTARGIKKGVISC